VMKGHLRYNLDTNDCKANSILVAGRKQLFQVKVMADQRLSIFINEPEDKPPML
jgi:hypothetical protein